MVSPIINGFTGPGMPCEIQYTKCAKNLASTEKLPYSVIWCSNLRLQLEIQVLWKHDKRLTVKILIYFIFFRHIQCKKYAISLQKKEKKSKIIDKNLNMREQKSFLDINRGNVLALPMFVSNIRHGKKTWSRAISDKK